MKKIIVVVVLALVICFCGSIANAELQEKTIGDDRFLVNGKGEPVYYMGEPYVTIDFDKKKFIVHPRVFYAPGTKYWDSFYDGFLVICSSHPATSQKPIQFNLGPKGGEVIPPKDVTNCSFSSFINKGGGKKFESKPLILFFE